LPWTVGQEEIGKPKIFYGWIITALVFLNLGVAYGAQYSFGVLFPSLIEEFQWHRQSIAGAFSLYTFMYGFLGIILGRWTDRFGPQIVLVFGSAFLGGGIALVSQVNSPWHLYVIYGLLASWGMSAAYMTANPTIVKWFIEKRGLALGISQSGLGVGIILIPPVTGVLIAAFGWRLACIILGSAVFATLFTTSFFLVGHPEKMGLLPDGRKGNPGAAKETPGRGTIFHEVAWSAGEAIRTKSFWVLTAIFFSTWLFVFLPLVHLVIFALDIGLSRKAAFTALSFLGAASTLGRLGMGYISDRVGRKRALVVNLAFQVFAWFWALGIKQSWMLILFSIVFGLSYGGVSAIFPAITGDYFGRLKAASVIGAIFTISGPAAAFGPLVGGFIYDRTQGYQLAFLLGALTNVLALILVFVSQPPGEKSPSRILRSPSGS
jgi:OFA family oxalate/formate antiporter-like MFS transporter